MHVLDSGKKREKEVKWQHRKLTWKISFYFLPEQTYNLNKKLLIEAYNKKDLPLHCSSLSSAFSPETMNYR